MITPYSRTIQEDEEKIALLETYREIGGIKSISTLLKNSIFNSIDNNKTLILEKSEIFLTELIKECILAYYDTFSSTNADILFDLKEFNKKEIEFLNEVDFKLYFEAKRYKRANNIMDYISEGLFDGIIFKNIDQKILDWFDLFDDSEITCTKDNTLINLSDKGKRVLERYITEIGGTKIQYDYVYLFREFERDKTLMPIKISQSDFRELIKSKTGCTLVKFHNYNLVKNREREIAFIKAKQTPLK